MTFTAETLPDDVGALKQMLLEMAARYNKETALLLEEIRLLRGQLFGRKSEKKLPEFAGRPLLLFDMPEPEEIEPAEELVEVPAHSRKKCGRKPLDAALPRVEVLHDLSEEEKVCACGCELTRMGEEVSEQLDIIPARIRVLRHIRPKYSCRRCEGVEDEGPTVRIAPVPPQIIPKSIASAGLLAHVITGKFVDHIPFYRQEKQLDRLGGEISRASMCNWAMQAAKACFPLLNLLQDEILAGSVVNVDETPLQVLKEPGRDPTSKSYMWIFRRGDSERTVLYYLYHPSRSGDVPKNFLRDFKGCVQTDGYIGYNFLDQQEGVRHIGCWAHARRKFTDVIKAQGKGQRKAGSADEALRYIGRIYKLEKKARSENWSSDMIYEARQKEIKPLLKQFRVWLKKRSLQTPPKGLLGKAIAYTLNQWERLIGYLEDGVLQPDNNAAENSIRPFVLGRKNWLFAGTPEGAEASALMYSLIETARANQLEPYSYLRHIFEKLPLAVTLEDYEALLPWNLDGVTLAKSAMDGVVA